MLDLLTFLPNNHRLFGLESLQPVSALVSKQPGTARPEWAVRGGDGGGWCQSPPPALRLELFF